MKKSDYSHNELINTLQSGKLSRRRLSRDPQEVLGAGKFMMPQAQEFEKASNKQYEEIKAGF